MKMYGLFSYSYNHYEWEDLVCVSDSVEKLIRYYYEDPDDSQEPLLVFNQEDFKSKRDEYKEKEVSHCGIRPIDFI